MRGMTLVELVVAVAIASVTGAMLMHLLISFQRQALIEISRNDLQDRAERLIRFMAYDLGTSAFIVGAVPETADDSQLALVHDSIPGDPVETFPSSIVAQDVVDGDDRITIIKAESFSPPITVDLDALPGDHSIHLSRRPNRHPGSSREIHPAPEAINHIVLANHPLAYAVQQAGQELQLAHELVDQVPFATEVLGLRVYSYLLDAHAGTNRLRRDDYTSRRILDDAVDGLQIEYLLADGTMVSQPLSSRQIRGIRISLLVRDLRKARPYVDENVYVMGNRTYGPYRDHFRRCVVTRLIEVKNHGLI